jgi:hypothetical protein
MPAENPVAVFLPYLGDYVHLMAVDRTFYGIFSANNAPDNSHFPSGVTYLRNADLATPTPLDLDNVTPVPISIDPYFFSVAPAGKLEPYLSAAGQSANVPPWSDRSSEVRQDG